MADILVFWTGASALPPCGFSDMLHIQFYDRPENEARRLPSASTCALILWLPRNVDDPDVLWQRFLTPSVSQLVLANCKQINDVLL